MRSFRRPPLPVLALIVLGAAAIVAGLAGGRAAAQDTDAATAIADGPAPWRNAAVQQCVRDYLDAVAFPVEVRLFPGIFTHFDDWGRLLGPNLEATGPVDGPWENATHFVWSQFGGARATRRYGVALRDYAIACLARTERPTGGQAAAPASPPADDTGTVRDLYDEARRKIQEANDSFRDNVMPRARTLYEEALEALDRALEADTAERYTREIRNAIDIARRNISRAASRLAGPGDDILARIAQGEPFTAIFDGACPADEGYTGAADPMGTLKCGESYAVTYRPDTGEWAVTGYNEWTDRIGTWVYSNADPGRGEISLWGRVFTVTTDGQLIDRDHGVVGRVVLGAHPAPAPSPSPTPAMPAAPADEVAAPEPAETRAASNDFCAVFVRADRAGPLGQRVDTAASPNTMRHSYTMTGRGDWPGSIVARWTRPPGRICSGERFRYAVEVENLAPDQEVDADFPVAIVSFAPVGGADLGTACTKPSPADPVSRVTVPRKARGAENRCASAINVVGGATGDAGGILFSVSLNAGPASTGIGTVNYVYRRER